MAIPEFSETRKAACESRPDMNWPASVSTHVHDLFSSHSVPLEETRELTEILFHNMVSERVRHELQLQARAWASPQYPEEAGDQQLDQSLDETDFSVSDLLRELCTPIEYKKDEWKKVGDNLRQIADKFAESREREEVRQTADRVSFRDQGLSSRETFFALLRGLFPDSKNIRERIVILFFFCTDLLLRALKDKVFGFARKVFDWSASFFRETVSQWVQEQGGWGHVLKSYVPSIAFTLCAVAVAFAALVYIRKNWN